MVGVILIPTMFSMLWFATFGGAGFFIEFYGSGGIADLVFEDVTRPCSRCSPISP
jgi:glycine betaine transporter